MSAKTQLLLEEFERFANILMDFYETGKRLGGFF